MRGVLAKHMVGSYRGWGCARDERTTWTPRCGMPRSFMPNAPGGVDAILIGCGVTQGRSCHHRGAERIG